MFHTLLLRQYKKLGERPTWMNSGHMRDMSPTMPPWTRASATPKLAESAHKPI